jgi:hypothetical protein
MIKKFLFFISLIFIWFLFAYYTLDYSSGEPVLSSFAFVLLLILLGLIIFNIFRFFKLKFKKSSH